MANVTSARHKSIVNNNIDSARLIFSSVDPSDHKALSGSRHRAIPSFLLGTIEINLLDGYLSVLRPRANSFSR